MSDADDMAAYLAQRQKEGAFQEPGERRRYRTRGPTFAKRTFVGSTAASGGAPPADTTAPTITSASSVSNAENSVLAHTLTANESVNWSIIGGADQARFELSGPVLRWLSNGTKDYETPNDANTDNAYIVQVRATDLSSNTTDQTITVTVTDVDETAPTITSLDTDSVAENATLSHALTANETVTWSIVGGADQTRFELSGSTLRWLGNITKDYEAPNDADTNNTYVVTVRATDLASNTTDQTITVTVTDVSEGGGGGSTPTYYILGF